MSPHNHEALSSFTPQPCRLGGIGCWTSGETEAQRWFLIHIFFLQAPGSWTAPFSPPLPLCPRYHSAWVHFPTAGSTILDLPTPSVVVGLIWCCQLLSSSGSGQVPAMMDTHSSYDPCWGSISSLYFWVQCLPVYLNKTLPINLTALNPHISFCCLSYYAWRPAHLKISLLLQRGYWLGFFIVHIKLYSS